MSRLTTATVLKHCLADCGARLRVKAECLHARWLHRAACAEAQKDICHHESVTLCVSFTSEKANLPAIVSQVVDLYFEDSGSKLEKLDAQLSSPSQPDYNAVDQLVRSTSVCWPPVRRRLPQPRVPDISASSGAVDGAE